MNRRTLQILKMAREKCNEIPFANKGNDGEVLTVCRMPEITKDDDVITANNTSFHPIQDMIENAEVIMDFGQASVNSTFIVSKLPEQCTKAHLEDIAQEIDVETNLVQVIK